MVTLKRFILTCIVLISLSIPGCDNDTKSDCGTAICTMEYRTVVILIKHAADNTPVVLTAFKVIRVSDNMDITIVDNNLSDNMGYYPLVNDSGKALLGNKNVEIEFRGFVNDALVVTKRFVVTADCCHVSLISGDTVAFI